jgi:hypothetical protein
MTTIDIQPRENTLIHLDESGRKKIKFSIHLNRSEDLVEDSIRLMFVFEESEGLSPQSLITKTNDDKFTKSNPSRRIINTSGSSFQVIEGACFEAKNLGMGSRQYYDSITFDLDTSNLSSGEYSIYLMGLLEPDNSITDMSGKISFKVPEREAMAEEIVEPKPLIKPPEPKSLIRPPIPKPEVRVPEPDKPSRISVLVVALFALFSIVTASVFWHRAQIIEREKEAIERQRQEAAEREAAAERQRQEAAEREAAAERQRQEAAEREAAAARQRQEAAEREAAAARQRQEAAEREAAAERQRQEAAEREAAAERQRQEAAEREAAAEQENFRNEYCVVTITNPLVSLMSDPETFSQEIIRIDPGEYTVITSQNTTFGGTTQRWLKISADGRQGWIRDNGWTIAEKSPACP